MLSPSKDTPNHKWPRNDTCYPELIPSCDNTSTNIHLKSEQFSFRPPDFRSSVSNLPASALKEFGVRTSLLGSYWSRETGLGCSSIPKTSLITQNAVRIRIDGSEKVTHWTPSLPRRSLPAVHWSTRSRNLVKRALWVRWDQ